MYISESSITALKRLDQITLQTINTILNEDENSTSQYLDQIRLHSASLDYNFSKKNNLEEGMNFDQEIAKSAKKLIRSITEKLEVIEKWCHRKDDRYTYDELTKTESGLNYLIDSFLPLSWNFNRDLIFLFSSYAEDLAELLIARGQRSLIIFSNKKNFRDEVKYVSNKEQVEFALLGFDILPKIVVSLEPLDLVKNKSEISEIYSEIDKFIHYLGSSKRTFNHFSQDWFNNKITNLKYMSRYHHLSELKSDIEFKDVVIVSPGPSLGDDINKLKEYSDRLIIIAVGQVCPILSQNGISPDYVVIIDAQEHSFVLKDLNLSNLKAFIFYDHVHENFHKIFPEIEKVIISIEGDGMSFLDLGFNVKEDISGGSVSVVALKIAIALGARRVGLMGQDLHLDAGHYYGEKKSEKFSLSDNQIQLKENIYKKYVIKTNSGKEAATYETYWTYLMEIEALLQRMPTQNVFNFSKHGARIKGATYQKFRDFCSKIDQRYPIKRKLLSKKNIFEKNKKEEIIKSNLKFLKNLTNEFQVKISKIIREYSKAGHNLKVEKLERELTNLYKLHFFMNIYSQKSLQLFEYHALAKKDTSNIHKKDLLLLYEALQKDVNKLNEIVKNELLRF